MRGVYSRDGQRVWRPLKPLNSSLGVEIGLFGCVEATYIFFFRV